jgi:hypothetical protein
MLYLFARIYLPQKTVAQWSRRNKIGIKPECRKPRNCLNRFYSCGYVRIIFVKDNPAAIQIAIALGRIFVKFYIDVESINLNTCWCMGGAGALPVFFA